MDEKKNIKIMKLTSPHNDNLKPTFELINF